MSRRYQVYRYWDAAGRLLYVGMTTCSFRRLNEHTQDSSWFDTIVRIDIERFDNRLAALIAEREAIITEKPLHNTVYARPQMPLEYVKTSISSGFSLILQRVKQADLARACGVHRQAITAWIREGRVPIKRVLAAEAVSGVPRHVIRPDAYPPPDAAQEQG